MDYSRDIIRPPLDLSSLPSARLTATLPSLLEAFGDVAANAAFADAPTQPAMEARKRLSLRLYLISYYLVCRARLNKFNW